MGLRENCANRPILDKLISLMESMAGILKYKSIFNQTDLNIRVI